MRHYGLNADSSQSSDGGASIEHTHTPVAP